MPVTLKSKKAIPLPQCFADKIRIDRVVRGIAHQDVISFSRAKKALIWQDIYRQKCRHFISKALNSTSTSA